MSGIANYGVHCCVERYTGVCVVINILTVFGTRPEAIKMAPILKHLQSRAQINSKLCITEQHQEMLFPVLELFHLTPDYNLHVMCRGQSLSQLTAKIILRLDEVLQIEKPDIMLVHGDTTTCFAAALSAFYHAIPVAHVEAGLRSHDLLAPWPEEANRKLTTSLAAIHFAPTRQARMNLLHEGVSGGQIHVTGNTVIDSLLDVAGYLDSHLDVKEKIQRQFSFLCPDRKVILVTGHRRENFGQGFQQICIALQEIARRFSDVDIVYPVHLNPSVQAPVTSYLAGIANIHLIEPVDYLPFVHLMQNAYLILTDSGGIQEEAPSLGKPVLVMRDNTERPEAINAGTACLVGTTISTIIENVEWLLTNKIAYQRMSQAQNPYGDGKASHRIVSVLEQCLMKQNEVCGDAAEREDLEEFV